MIEIRLLDPLRGSDAEPLWYEGEASYVEAGRGRHTVVTPPPKDLVAWVAYVDGQPVGLHAVRRKPEEQNLYGMLAWVKPEFRGLKLFNFMRRQMDIDSIGLGYQRLISEVVDGPESPGMRAAIENMGGQKTGEVVVQTASGPVVYHQYSRPLKGF